MITVRRSRDRGHAQFNWLDSYHSFSFASYYDPQFMGFRDLRVINEDRIAGGQGFPTHPHRDMEIITYVVSGELAHKDTLGNETKIKPGEVQRMSAGTGIQHSEYNSRNDGETHLLQIWILPSAQNLKPGYGQKNFVDSYRKNPLTLAVSPDGRDESIAINQNAELWVGQWSSASQLEWNLNYPYGWIQVVKGPLIVNDMTLENGDGAAISSESRINIASKGPVEFLIFHLN